ncbi:MAG: S1 RNA-binding domain-containing protein, partial [Oscillospiraceae bacterium]|nr:S1 RNA-binding domain-containing protein [Oscillospiraceae bacterium]
MDRAFKAISNGDIVKGKVISITPVEVFVDFGYKSEGMITIEDFTNDPAYVAGETLKIGDEVEAQVVRVNDAEGLVVLSKRHVDNRRNTQKVKEAFDAKTPIKARVTSVVKGGVIANVSNVRIFIPASQVAESYVEDLAGIVGKTFDIMILECDIQKRKIIGSRKSVIVKDKKSKMDEFWGSVEKGAIRRGVVKRFTNFGVFVDVGGVDGLIHISEISWKRTDRPSDVFKIDQEVEVTILDYDKSRNKVSLGYRKDEDNPWNTVEDRYIVGENVIGRVVRLVPFGAFISLEDGIDGLVHISQISSRRIEKAGDA